MLYYINICVRWSPTSEAAYSKHIVKISSRRAKTGNHIAPICGIYVSSFFPHMCAVRPRKIWSGRSACSRICTATRVQRDRYIDMYTYIYIYDLFIHMHMHIYMHELPDPNRKACRRSPNPKRNRHLLLYRIHHRPKGQPTRQNPTDSMSVTAGQNVGTLTG